VSTPVETIATNSVGAWGDPHFNITMADGTHVQFDAQGQAGNTYNVFSGDGLTFDASYTPYQGSDSVNVMGVVRMETSDNQYSVYYDMNGNLQIDGPNGVIPNPAAGHSISFQDSGTGDTITVTANSDGSVTITNNYKLGEPAQVTLTAEEGGITVDPTGSWGNTGGIIGYVMQNESAPTDDWIAQNCDVTATAAVVSPFASAAAGGN